MKVAAWLAALLPAVVAADDLGGSTIPPYPAGLVNEQGACVRECDFSLGILEDASSVPKTLFGARLAGRDDKGRARWTITDVVPYPILPEGYYLAMTNCESGSRKDETILAVGRGGGA